MSSSLLWLLVTAAIVAFAALVVGWPRLSRRGARSLAARAGCLLGVQALLTLVLLVAANDTFGFYASWDDLLGVGGSVQTLTAGAAAGTIPASSTLRPQSQSTAQSTDKSTGKSTTRPQSQSQSQPQSQDWSVRDVQLSGRVSGMTGSALVLLPPGYDDPANAGRRYPVIEAFHGYPGNPQQWLTDMPIREDLTAAVAAKQITPSIVVVPNLAVPAGRDTECLNGPAGQPQLETWLSVDVPDDIDTMYRVQTGRRAWAAAGFSMGGWCAALVTMDHPTTYAAALVFSGYFTYDPGAWRPFARTSAAARRVNLVARAHRSPPAVNLWVLTCRTDHLSYPSSRALTGVARAPLGVTTVVEATGGHRMGVWAPQIPSALAWLGRTVPAFRPQ